MICKQACGHEAKEARELWRGCICLFSVGRNTRGTREISNAPGRLKARVNGRGEAGEVTSRWYSSTTSSSIRVSSYLEDRGSCIYSMPILGSSPDVSTGVLRYHLSAFVAPRADLASVAVTPLEDSESKTTLLRGGCSLSSVGRCFLPLVQQIRYNTMILVGRVGGLGGQRTRPARSYTKDVLTGIRIIRVNEEEGATLSPFVFAGIVDAMKSTQA